MQSITNLETTDPRASRSVARSWAALTCLAFLYPVIVAITQKEIVCDDPFILMRYGQHLADGIGWNFNPSLPSSNAVTSPLFVLLIAAGAFLGANPETCAIILYVAAWGLGGIVLARILLADGRRTGAWLGCGLYSISPLIANVRGMETSLYLLLILAAVWAFQRQRWLILGILLGLLAMTRTDSVLLAAALIGWLLIARRDAVLRVAVPFAAITALWTAMLWALTGSAVPSTLASKLAQRDSGAWGSQWGYLLGLNINGLMGQLDYFPGIGILGLIGNLMVIAAIWGTVIAIRRREHALPLLAAAALITVAEYGLVLRMSQGFLWHYAPWTLWVIAGTAILLDHMRRHRISVSVVAAVLAAGLIFSVDLSPNEVRGHYRQVAEWIDRDTHKPHPTVAVNEIGTIGYYSRADIIDYLGLLDADAIEPVRHRDFTWWLTQHPDYWVSSTSPWDTPTLDLPQFQREYKAAATFGTITIYRHT